MFVIVLAFGVASVDVRQLITRRNAEEPHAKFDVNAFRPENAGGCYHAPSADELATSAARAPFSFTDDELRAASEGASIDWRKAGAVGPIQQQHPYGTCWAFSMVAVTEAINVIQGKNEFQKLSEQMVVSCVPETACGDNADVLWSWAFHTTGARYQTEAAYPYNRTCNFFREQQLSPDGTTDGYPGKCDLPGPPPYAPCPPCPGVTRKDGTPPCHIDSTKGFSNASVRGWGFIAPHGRRRLGVRGGSSELSELQEPNDVTRMVAALAKYGPAQIGIDASCVAGYKSGIITNCTSRNVDHAVAIVGAGTDAASAVDYWIVRNSWGPEFGEDGYFRVQRDTHQMGIFGGYFGCYNKDCMVDP